MSNPMKDFFAAGLALEEAREDRERARERLREAAAKVCPTELAALEAASDALRHAEEGFAKAGALAAFGGIEMARRALEEHSQKCDDPNCVVRKKLQELIATERRTEGLN